MTNQEYCPAHRLWFGDDPRTCAECTVANRNDINASYCPDCGAKMRQTRRGATLARRGPCEACKVRASGAAQPRRVSSCPQCDGPHTLPDCPEFAAGAGTPLIAGLRKEIARLRADTDATHYPAALLRGPFVFKQTSAGYTGIWTNGAELSDREVLRTLNEQGALLKRQEEEISKLRLQLAQGHEHVGALVGAVQHEQAASDTYEATRGTEDWPAAGDVLGEAAIATARALVSARAWLRS